MIYALVSPNGEVMRTVEVDDNPAPNLAPNKGRWLAVVETAEQAEPGLVVTGSRVEMVDGVPTRVCITGPKPTEPASAPPPVRSVSRLQFLLAGVQIGLWTMAEAQAAARLGALPAAVTMAIAALPAADHDMVVLVWAAMATVARDSTMLALIAQALSKTEADIDALFDLAENIN